MEPGASLPQDPPNSEPNHQMEVAPPSPLLDDHSSAAWDWGDLLDFTVDDDQDQDQDHDHDHFPLTSLDSLSMGPSTGSSITSPVPDRIRKRDPRLICSNFLAGRVPCACPELDEKLEEEEVGLPGKKRVRVSGSGTARCQVPRCKVDISELKGYHRRHRVCLRCANAGSVVVDGETKRYCQQCGKFHVLSDFDEGKRSCRRKLERHNNRRRRKPLDSRVSVDKEAQGDLQTEETACDGEPGTDILCVSSQTVVEKEVFVESEDGHVSVLHSDPNCQNTNSDSGVSVAASGDTQIDSGKENLKFSLSPSYCDNKSAYLSVCPTGRMSFKLYDWNPAEFPRRLRLQIFQWLASMPVELEGYIRPGCTILTVFIAMPTFMWVKLLEDPMSRVHDLVVAPGKLLSGRGPMLIYLNNMIFQFMKDGSSLIKVDVKEQAPRLHYVYPICFEAGRPMEFVACGSNLLQRKFRFLVSFEGKYLTYDSCVALPHDSAKGISSLEHQLYRIFIPSIEPNHFGPAFIEVENESGLSNFIPVLIGDRAVCCEMRTIQQGFDASHLPKGSKCEVFASSQMAFSEFLVDIAWLLKKPSPGTLKQIMTSSQIQRFTSLFNFLLCHESTAILDRILLNLKSAMDEMDMNSANNGTSDTNMWMLQNYVKYASDVSGSCAESGLPSVAPFINQGLEEAPNDRLETSSTPVVASGKVPLLSREVVMNMNLIKERPSKSCSLSLSNRVLKSRPAMFAVAVAAFCFGVCVAVLHPHKVSQFTVTIRGCLTDSY